MFGSKSRKTNVVLTTKAFDLGFLKIFQGKPPRDIVVACSGGVDSMVLLDLCRRLYAKRGDKILAVYIDHGQREARSIKRDLFLIRRYCLTHGLTFAAKSIEPKQPGRARQASEAFLRERRYAALAQAADARVVLTAHHADDQLETFLLRLLRGAHPLSLRGIALKSRREGLRLARPLLFFTKNEIREFALREKLKWNEDTTNNSKQYARNRVRLELIPLIENIRPGARRRLLDFFLTLQPQAVSPCKNSKAVARLLASKQGIETKLVDFARLKNSIDFLLGPASQKTSRFQWNTVERLLLKRQQSKEGGGPEKTVQFPGGFSLQFKKNRMFWLKS